MRCGRECRSQQHFLIIMRILQNSEYDSPLVYFHGIQYPNMWTVENPAVYQSICVKNSSTGKETIRVPGFLSMSESPLYLAFMAFPDTSYIISEVSTTEKEMRLELFDMLTTTKNILETDDYINATEENHSENCIKYGHIKHTEENSISFHFSLSYPTLCVARITPVSYESLFSAQDEIRHMTWQFNDPPPEMDLNAGYRIDVQHRIKSHSYGANGKLPVSKSLK